MASNVESKGECQNEGRTSKYTETAHLRAPNPLDAEIENEKRPKGAQYDKLAEIVVVGGEVKVIRLQPSFIFTATTVVLVLAHSSIRILRSTH